MRARASQSSNIVMVVFASVVIVGFMLIGQAFCFSTTSNHRTLLANTSPKSLLSKRNQHQQQKIRRYDRQQTDSFSMHMGHSHSHSHSHQRMETVGIDTKSSQQQQQQQQQLQQQTPLFNLFSVPLWAKRRRISALLLFCAVAILVPPLVVGKALSKKDISAFFLTSTCLFLMEPIRNQVKHVLLRIRQLSDGISRHSSPITPQYIFKNESAADRVTLMGGAINVVLSLSKFLVGVSCHSAVLIADAGHSLSDLFSDIITLWAVNVGRLPPDADHPYGHGKFEAVGSLFLSLTLFGTGIGVGAVSNKRLLEILSMQRGVMSPTTVLLPKLPALFMAALSIVSKEWLFRVTRDVGERLNSQIVIANAWHHRSDAYSSVLALGSIALAMYVPGLVAIDAAAGLFVAGMICMTGAEIMGESIKQLTDTSNDELVEQITLLAAKSDDVFQVNRVRARQVGSSSTVDVSVSMLDDKSASAARAVEARLKQSILQLDGVLDVDVRATSPGVFCPLLEASNPLPLSASEIENSVKDRILMNHPEIKSVEGVIVHYQDTLLVNVDVHIRLLDMDSMKSLVQANALAATVRDTIEQSSHVNKAKIFLDLNQEVPSSVS